MSQNTPSSQRILTSDQNVSEKSNKHQKKPPIQISNEGSNLEQFLISEPFLTTPNPPETPQIFQSPLPEIVSIDPQFPSPLQSCHTIIYKNGLKYEGAVTTKSTNGELIPLGEGIYESPDGDKFEGEISERGKGKLIYADGTVYEGMFYKMQKAGKGVEIYGNGTEYRGMFKQNMKWGKGKMKFGNGDLFEGNFKEGKRNGIGKYVIAKGGEFVGDWKDDFLEGTGKWIVGNGSEIPASFVKSKVKL